MKKPKKPEIVAYIDGEKLCNVIEAALENNMLVSDLKKKLIEENQGHDVTFKIER